MAMTVVAVEPKVTLFAVMFIYVLSGPGLMPFHAVSSARGVAGEGSDSAVLDDKK